MRATKRQRGFTLTEVMVATAIFTIIMLAALLMYDRNNRVFKSGVQASDLQQNTRIGFDKLVSDLRIEGFDYNRNGDPSGADQATGVNYQKQPDEQIEFMGDSAIAFRANFNYNTGYDNGREGDKRNNPLGDPNDTYESPAFPLVTTSNSEIVIYALKSADPTKNTSLIQFYADVSKPRAAYVGTGGTPAEKQVTISGYDTSNNYPPYTLYRLTLRDANLDNNDANPVGNAVPIAMNVRSLKFTYYSDQGGTQTIAANQGAGQYNASNPSEPTATAARLVRSSIQAIKVDLIGMESAPDKNYSSPLETASSGITDTSGRPVSEYREYNLSSLIVPRNVGKRAVKEEDLKQPEPAILKTICYGACSVPYLTWQAPKDGNVDFYAIIYDSDVPGGDCSKCSFSNGYPVGNVTEAYFPRPLSPGTKYFFRIEASNGYGDSQSQETASIYAINTTTPNPPQNGNATTTLTNRVRLTWQAPKAYTSTSPALTCFDPLGSPAGTNAVSQNGFAPPEIIAYRIYRAKGDANSGFDPNSTGELIASEANGIQPYIDVNGLATFDDYVPACINYYYRIQAVAADCVNSTDYNSPKQTSVAMSTFLPDVNAPALKGSAKSAAPPAAPTNFTLARPTDCPAAGTLRGVGIKCSLQLSWSKVTQDTSTPPQPVKIDNYILTRTQLYPTAATGVPINVDGAWETGGNTLNYVDPTPANSTDVAMTDDHGRSYQYKYSLVADTNSCSSPSAAVTWTEPATYFALSGEPVTATTSDGGNGSSGSPYELYGGSSTLIFTGPGLTALYAYFMDAGGNQIGATVPKFASPAVFGIPSGLNTGQLYHVDFIATDGTGYYTETVFFIQQGGVCDYAAAPAAVSSATQTNNGLSLAKPWSLQPNQTIKWTATDLSSAVIKLIDTTNNSTVQTITTSGTTETLTWPTLTFGKTYEVDALLTSNINCQREEFYFVTQVCAAYGGGTPTFTVSDASHTGLSSASAWQILTGGTIKVTETTGMKSLQLTVTDLTANKSFATATYTAAAGVVTITWPPTNVTGANNDIYQMNLVLVDANGCTSSTYTRYATQYCAYSGSNPTFANTQTLRKTTDSSGTGASTSSPLLMVPNLDLITVTESSVKTVYVDYLDTSGNALSGVTTQTWTGSSPIKFSNPYISGKNNQTYRIDITLADSNGCKSSKTTYYVTQVPCVLRPQANATDTSIISDLYNPTGNGSNLANLLTIYNRTNQQINIVSVTLEFGNLGAGQQVKDVKFTTNTVTVGVQTGPTTVTAPGGTTIAALGSTTIQVDYNYKPTVTPLTGVCITYTTTQNTPSNTVTQSCNINYSASASVSNPNGCD